MSVGTKTKLAMDLMKEIAEWEARKLVALSKIAALTDQLQRIIDGGEDEPITGDTIAERILTLLGSKPHIAWENGTIAKKLWVQAPVVGATLSRLHKAGQVRKVARGLYQISPKPRKSNPE